VLFRSRVKSAMSRFTRTRTKRELLDAAVRHDLLIAPVSTIDEVVASEQLAARAYWRDVPSPIGGAPVRHPGPFARFGATPLAYRRRAPRIGEHNREVYERELGLDVAALTAEGVV